MYFLTLGRMTGWVSECAPMRDVSVCVMREGVGAGNALTRFEDAAS